MTRRTLGDAITDAQRTILDRSATPLSKKERDQHRLETDPVYRQELEQKLQTLKQLPLPKLSAEAISLYKKRPE